jgi:hypothetical protein
MKSTHTHTHTCTHHTLTHVSLFLSVHSRVAGRCDATLQGNKGGVGVRFRLYDSYLTFVNSHLASGTKEVERRNLDYREIAGRLLFPGAADDPSRVPTIYDGEYAH